MSRKLPKLKPREVEANLQSLGFVHARTDGSHKQYVREGDGTRKRAVVTVDVGKTQFGSFLMNQFGSFLMKMMIRQSLLTQEEFCSGVLKTPAVQPKTVAAAEGSKNA